MCSIFLLLKYSIVWYTLTGFKVPVLYKDIKTWFYFTKFLLTDSMKFNSSFNIQFQ